MNARYLEHKLARQEDKLARIRRSNLVLTLCIIGLTVAGIALNPWILPLALIPLALLGFHKTDIEAIEKEIEETTFYIHQARLKQEEDLTEWAQQMLNEQ